MSNIRRFYNYGNRYFVTCVAHKRTPILVNNARLLLDSIDTVAGELSLDIHAYVILPDHFHMLIDPKNANLSGAIRKIKLRFSTRFKAANELPAGRTWQNRFWDHVIRDERDY
ncbi:MAG: transposase [bacterium]|nr:transposase [bacterium]